MEHALRLVEAMEESWSESVEVLDLGALSSLLEARAPLLDELSRLELGELGEDERAALKERLREVYRRDQSLMKKLVAARDATGVGLKKLADARQMARTYRGASTREAGMVLRRA